MTAALSYSRFELLRAFRNRRFFFFSLAFPLVLYLLIAGPNGGEDDLGGSGIPARLYFMVGLAAFGTMNGVVAAGARIAAERQVGWTRQLRHHPAAPERVHRDQAPDRVHVRAADDRGALRGRDRARRAHARPRVAGDDRGCCCSACCRSRRSGSRSATC